MGKVSINALSIDVEDWFQPLFLENKIPRQEWDRQLPRISESIVFILEILSRCRTKATFFILGWVAEFFPEIPARIAEAGHEIAIHGYDHRLVFQQSPDEFEQDVRKARDLVTKAAGITPQGYRAPTFSIKEDETFFLLKKCGLSYSSSIYPTGLGVLAGRPSSPRVKHEIIPGFWEIPLAVFGCGKFKIPFSGGFYFRAIPLSIYKKLIRWENSRGRPVVFYIHPWELFPDFPRLPLGALKSFVTYYNLKNTADKFERLIRDFSFAPIRDVFFGEKNGQGPDSGRTAS